MVRAVGGVFAFLVSAINSAHFEDKGHQRAES